MHVLEQILKYKFLSIISKHNNGLWALQELEWLVYVKNADLFNQLSQDDQWVVRRYLMGLRKIYGDN